jgi:magnesium transporter
LRPAARRAQAALPWIPEVDRSSAIIDFAIYCDGVRQPDPPSWLHAYDSVRESGTGFVWIGLREPSTRQLTGLAEEFGLHPLAVEDAVNAHQRPKIDHYDDMLFTVVKTVHYNRWGEHEVSEVLETGEIMVFLGKDFVITVRHGEHGSLRNLRRDLESDPERLRQGPSAVLHGVLDVVVDNYLRVCSAIEDDVDEAEVAMFAGTNRAAQTNRIYILKREALTLRRVAAPLVGPLRRLGSGAQPLVADDVEEYFRDVEDHLSQVVEQIGSFDELLTSLVNSNLAQVSVAQNEDMRKISAWVAIAAVPTMVAGIYGMNFEHMPELHWRYGYLLIMVVVVSACVGLYAAFKRNGWL